MQEVCPQALMLNYTNPMVMLSWAVAALTGIRYVGLCHSVQGTAMAMARYIGVPFEEVSYWAAGINHMAWYLKFLWKGRDAYPLLWEAMENPEIYVQDIVKWEVMKHFGAFVSESSIHMSEYVPYFRRTPELIDRHTSEKMWGVSPKGTSRQERMAAWQKRRQAQEEENQRLAFGQDEIPIVRGSALNALESESTDPEADEYEFVWELIRVVDEYIPMPERDVDRPFLMPIEDVFGIKGRGTVVTGRVTRGKIKPMTPVEILIHNYPHEGRNRERVRGVSDGHLALQRHHDRQPGNTDRAAACVLSGAVVSGQPAVPVALPAGTVPSDRGHPVPLHGDDEEAAGRQPLRHGEEVRRRRLRNQALREQLALQGRQQCLL